MAKKLKYSYDDCYNAAKQCDSLKEFRARFNAIRQFSDKHGYTKTFDWLKKRVSPGFWTKELAVEESKKYTTRAEFKEKNQYVYILSYKMGWLEEMDWLDTYILTKKYVSIIIVKNRCRVNPLICYKLINSVFYTIFVRQ